MHHWRSSCIVLRVALSAADRAGRFENRDDKTLTRPYGCALVTSEAHRASILEFRRPFDPYA